MKKFIFLFLSWSVMSFSAVTSSNENPIVIILLGPPGSGKGTHAVNLSEQLQVPHISTGDLFREHLRQKTPLGNKAQMYMNQGQLVPDELVFDILLSKLSEQGCEKGYILDGFPRTLFQAQTLEGQLSKKATIMAIHLTIPDHILVERIVGRLMCKECNTPYHKTFSPSKKGNICEKCGGLLYHREDDKESIVLSRLEVYHKESQSLLDYYDFKNHLYDVNAQKAREEVFQDLIQTIEAVYSESSNIMSATTGK